MVRVINHLNEEGDEQAKEEDGHEACVNVDAPPHR